MTINSTIRRSKRGGGKDRGQSKEGRGIKGRLLGGLSEVSLLVLRLVEGLPDTGSHPAQMGIGVSSCGGFPREKYHVVCVVSKQTVRDLARVGLKNACGKTKTRCHQFNERKA